MTISKACTQILQQLEDMVKQINVQDFIRPSEILGRSTIGQHLRHTLEFFICFERGLSNGIINYDKRSHDRQMEKDKRYALLTIQEISNFVNNLEEDQVLKLEIGYDVEGEIISEKIETNALRELVYNLEHAVHHMAIMKIGISDVAPYVKLPPDFGIAASTIRYKEKLQTLTDH